MRETIKKILAQKGPAALIASIGTTVRDFKRLQYTRGEISETLREWFWGLDGKVDKYIEELGY